MLSQYVQKMGKPVRMELQYNNHMIYVSLEPKNCSKPDSLLFDAWNNVVCTLPYLDT